MKASSLIALLLLSVLMPGGDTVCAAPKSTAKQQKPSVARKKVSSRPARATSKAAKVTSISTPASTASAVQTADPAIDQRIIDLDITPPDLSITSHSGLRIEHYAGTSISLSGVASDDLKIAGVNWYTTRGVEGVCVGIENWRADSIPLFPGENLITVAATDLAGNIGVDCITVVSTANIEMKLIAPAASVAPKQVVDISVVCTNLGTEDVTGLLVQPQVPLEMEYVPGSAESSGGSWNAATRTVSWTIDSLKIGESGTRIFKAIVK